MVFTIPEEYRIIFRKDRNALNLLFVASRNTLAKMFNKSLFDKLKGKNLLKSKFKMIKFRQLNVDSYNRDPLKCKCGSIMVYESSYDPLEGRINDRNYRKECINEMRSLRLRRIC